MKPVIIERTTVDTAGLKALAMLRMVVFRHWPYLYDGDAAYELAYLRDFLGSEAASLVVARVGDLPVGMATASSLSAQPATLTAPVTAAGIDVDQAYYFGESVLLPQFQGLGIGHRFFDEREAAAREAGARHVIFCAVVRDAAHPSRPEQARDLAPFWQGRGYVPLPGALTTMGWRETGSAQEQDHPMQFWTKLLTED